MMTQGRPTRAIDTALLWLLVAASASLLWLEAQQHKLWLDDLYTIHLVTGSLTDLLSAIAHGVDANPPFYMLLAWGTVQLPFPATPEAKLAALSVVLGCAMLLALFRLAREFVSFEAALIALAILLGANHAAIEPMLHLRTYPLFLLCVALAALFALRWQQRGAPRDALRLALACVALSMSHTFGLAYALMIAGSAALVSARESGVRAGLTMLYPVLPAVAVTALWVPVLLLQLRIASPYGWIEPPEWRDLLRQVFPDNRAGVVGAAMLTAIATVRVGGVGLSPQPQQSLDRKTRTALLALASFVLFAAAAWCVSWLVTPIFVTRYFAPSLLVYFAIAAAFAGRLLALIPRRLHLLATAGSTALGVLVVGLASPTEGTIPCYDAARQEFIETGRIDPKLPVITESPHAWFPRTYYAPTPATYIFPLDWDVVERFPQNERNNAVDYNIMWHLRRINGTPTILTSDELITRFKEFYVVNEQKRAWLRNLRGSHALQENVVATSATCSLVRVRVDG